MEQSELQRIIEAILFAAGVRVEISRLASVLEVDENDTSVYETRVVRMFDEYDFDFVKNEKENGDEFTYKMSREFAVKGIVQKFATDVYGKLIEAVTGRQVSYPD